MRTGTKGSTARPTAPLRRWIKDSHPCHVNILSFIYFIGGAHSAAEKTKKLS